MKFAKKRTIIVTIIILAILIFLFFFSFQKLNIEKFVRDNACPVSPPAQTVEQKSNSAAPVYKARSFDLANHIKGISKQQLDDHKTLYERYATKRNEIAQRLNNVNREQQNKTYSDYRALKLAETYAMNGSILHELYFENMNKKPTAIGKQMQELIEHSFGSTQAFKEDLMAAARCARGWVFTAYALDDGLVHNFVLEEHNQTVPVLAMPLLVLDVYEHAYMIGFGIDIGSYLDVFWDNIDWEVVESRINKWVNPLKAATHAT